MKNMKNKNSLPSDLEPEMEALLLRLVPNLAEQWEGASPEEIDELERIAGRPLPRFYRWFLTRMGHSMGPIAYPTLDFSIKRILSCYAKQTVIPDPRFLLIGYENDEFMPLHIFYDFDFPNGDDARVTAMEIGGGDDYPSFDTFREMLAWGKMLVFAEENFAQQCTGIVEDEGGETSAKLEPVMHHLGFKAPIPTGPRCGLFERPDAAIILDAPLDDEEAIKGQVFHIGASDAATIRRILDTIVSDTSLELEVDSWEPPLP